MDVMTCKELAFFVFFKEVYLGLEGDACGDWTFCGAQLLCWFVVTEMLLMLYID